MMIYQKKNEHRIEETKMRSKRQKLENKLDLGPASAMQKKYAKSIKVLLPEDATRSDAAALINRGLDDDEASSASLRSYARSKEIVCSDYVGNKYLHTLMFDHLQDKDKASFFCFCVYKFHKWLQDHPLSNENLEEDPHSELFIQFGEEKESNISFIDTMNTYIGEEIVYFGKVTKILPNGKKEVIYGGSKLTSAYKDAYAYLIEKGLLTE